MLCRVVAIKRLPVPHHSTGYILFPLGSWSPSWLFWKKRIPLKPALGGLCTYVVGTYSCRIHALIKFDAIEAYRNYNIRLIQKCACGVNFRKTDVVLCVVTWSGRIHVDYFYVKEASQTTVLHMKRLNKTESPTVVIECVLCFQRQYFLLLFYSTAAGVVPCGGHKTSPRTSS